MATKTKTATKKKKTAKNVSGPTAASKTHTLKYTCANSTCRVSTKRKHMKVGDVAVLLAIGTDATLRFTSGSPFASGATTVSLSDGMPDTEVIGHLGTFPYKLSCRSCAGSPAGDPEMIVP